MATRFLSSTFELTGIQSRTNSWTLADLETINQTMDDNIDSLISFSKFLGAQSQDVVLSTYKNKENVTTFNLPKVVNNGKSGLVVSFGQLLLPLIYDKKAKGYTCGDASFEVEGYIRENETEVKAVNLLAVNKVEIDGFPTKITYSIKVGSPYLATSDELVSLTKDLVAGKAIESNRITTIGSGGTYENSIKACSVPKGVYKVVSVKKPQALPKGGYAYEGYIQPVDESGNLTDDKRILIAMGAGPFKTKGSMALLNKMIRAFESGSTLPPVYASFDGAYMSGTGYPGAIAYSREVQDIDTDFTTFLQDAKSNQTRIRMENSSSLMSESELAKFLDDAAKKKADDKAKAGNNIVEGPKVEPKVPVPQLDDIPF